ncbi:MAG: acyl-CoA dehydrogenase family protein [Acidimicrobiales bacterium]
MDGITEPTEFRAEVAEFLAASRAAGVACEAFGAILPPMLLPDALRWQRHVADNGYAGLHWPVEFGGRGLDRAYSAIWYEECARARVAPYLNLQGIVLAGEAIMRSGTDEQKQRFLAETLTGDIVWCQLFSEPGAGSDLAGLATRATKDGDRYVLNGQKVWCSNGQLAHYGILLARTDEHLPKHKGISFFLLDMTLPGVDVRPLKQMTGDEEFCEVFFDDVEVPGDALLGPEHGGWRVAMEVLGDERGSFGSAGVISLQQKLDGLTTLLTDPTGDTATGSSGPAAPGGLAVDRLASLLARGNALRALLERTSDDVAMAPAAKVLRSEVDVETNALTAGLRGPAAMLWDAETEAFLYAPGMRIAGGTSEIQRNIIGERLLGLPREPAPPGDR